MVELLLFAFAPLLVVALVLGGIYFVAYRLTGGSRRGGSRGPRR